MPPRAFNPPSSTRPRRIATRICGNAASIRRISHHHATPYPSFTLARTNSILPDIKKLKNQKKPKKNATPQNASGVTAKSGRRDFLAAQIIAAASATQTALPSDAWAALEGSVLPKDYTDKARTLVKTLTASLEFEASNPSDADRFRNAEPAKVRREGRGPWTVDRGPREGGGGGGGGGGGSADRAHVERGVRPCTTCRYQAHVCSLKPGCSHSYPVQLMLLRTKKKRVHRGFTEVDATCIERALITRRL